jgi:hypothetical protein
MMSRASRHATIFIACIALSQLDSSSADARLMRFIECGERVANSNLIVIARPVTKTTVTGEISYFPGLAWSGPGAAMGPVKANGVATTFKAMRILKGYAKGGRFVLHHLQEQPDPATGKILASIGGANTVSFEPSGVGAQTS